jgi:hypothetical protein
MIAPEASVHWWRSPRVAWVAEADRAVLLNLEADAPQPEQLDDTAAAIWTLLGETPLSFDQIVRRLANAYHIAPDAIRADVAAFLERLRANGFAESSELS